MTDCQISLIFMCSGVVPMCTYRRRRVRTLSLPKVNSWCTLVVPRASKAILLCAYPTILCSRPTLHFLTRQSTLCAIRNHVFGALLASRDLRPNIHLKLPKKTPLLVILTNLKPSHPHLNKGKQRQSPTGHLVTQQGLPLSPGRLLRLQPLSLYHFEGPRG